jgi:GLTT repeat (6 copies)
MSRKNLRQMMIVGALGVLAAGGCRGDDDADAPVGSTSGALVGSNGLFANGLFANGLFANGLFANGLFANGLFANGLALQPSGTMSPAAADVLRDPAVRPLFSYIVSCALPANQTLKVTVDGQALTFPGAIGVAPEWQTGTCDTSCQRWVTACVIARVNHLGQHVEISMRGQNRALAIDAHEVQDFTFREAAYFGNFFLPRPEVHACLPDGATGITRVCGPSLVGCPVAVAGRCEDVCAGTGAWKSFRDCAAAPVAQAAPSVSRDVFPQTVTVFLKP